MTKLTNNKLTIKGKSGTDYKFEIYELNTEFKEIGGIYVFTKRAKSNDEKYSHTFIYCGKTGDASTRFDSHHKKDCIKKNGANCICFMVVKSEAERTKIETDILTEKNFTCNEVLN